jgi:rhodanese-related sulfurtransferase
MFKIPGSIRVRSRQRRLIMAQATRIDPRETRKKIESGEALLVCAYDDEEKCNQMHLEGAMNLQELEEKLAEIPKEKELIFYCA